MSPTLNGCSFCRVFQQFLLKHFHWTTAGSLSFSPIMSPLLINDKSGYRAQQNQKADQIAKLRFRAKRRFIINHIVFVAASRLAEFKLTSSCKLTWFSFPFSVSSLLLLLLLFCSRSDHLFVR